MYPPIIKRLEKKSYNMNQDRISNYIKEEKLNINQQCPGISLSNYYNPFQSRITEQI